MRLKLTSLLILASSFALAKDEGDDQATVRTQLPPMVAASPPTFVDVQKGPTPTPKISPKQKWEFQFKATGYATVAGQIQPRVNVYAQKDSLLTAQVARIVMRLWEFNYRQLDIDQYHNYNNRMVDVYLCWQGKAGGEQTFDHEKINGRDTEVNTIYLYDVANFGPPAEIVREVAHEYGHATLAPVGGYKQPEYWANGLMGEKLYMRWLRDQLDFKTLNGDDIANADQPSIRDYVKTDVDPLIKMATASPLGAADLQPQGQKSMDEYLGLMMTAYSIMPQKTFLRTMKLFAGGVPTEFPKAMIDAFREVGDSKIHFPDLLKNTLFWAPFGADAKIQGAKVLETKGDWLKLQVNGNGPFFIQYPAGQSN